MLTIPQTDSQSLISLILNRLFLPSPRVKNTFTLWMLLTFLAMTSSPASAWFLGIPPDVTIISPTTSDNIYVTEEDTIDIAGTAVVPGSIERVDWILFDLEAWQHIDSGEATLENQHIPLEATWSVKDIKIPYGKTDITVIAFDAVGGSDHDRLVIVRTKKPLEEVFYEDIAQSDPEDSCGRQTGDPIDIATGAQFLQQTLLTVQGYRAMKQVLPTLFQDTLHPSQL